MLVEHLPRSRDSRSSEGGRVLKLSHLSLALRAVRCAATELRPTLALEAHSEAQRMLIAADLREMHGTVDALARRRAQSVANRKPPPPKVKGWRSTMSPAERKEWAR
jgi:hypothetical protein